MIKPRPYQEEALTAVKAEREAGITRCLVSLPTGTGKTPIAAMLIAEIGKPTLFLAHREELLRTCPQ
jgi:superfamily II DNA or RNA helicase